MSVAKLFEGETSVPEHIPRIFEDLRRFPKIAEDFRVRPEDVSMNTNEFKYNLRDKLDISEIIDIFTCENIISSHMPHVRISYRFYQVVTTRYTLNSLLTGTWCWSRSFLSYFYYNKTL